ncbi:hypothetical protein ACP4OV_018052 [Aristida adscensionis]
MDEGWWDGLPTDAFVEILGHVPPGARRRLRLVCRLWRAVIDERAPDKPGRPVALAFVHNGGGGTALAVDGGRPEEPRRELWTDPGCVGDNSMVGTCNGLLCLFSLKPAGAVLTVARPATGETLALPPLPHSSRHWLTYVRLEAFCFGFHPATGRYKLLHVPCYLDKTGHVGAVQVFALGEASWRDVVPAPAGASCRIDAGLAAVGGAAYWVTKSSERLVAFDLGDERVASTTALPVQAGPGYLCRLTEVRGRLGIVSSADERTPAKIEVWVLGDGGGRQEWSRRYRVQMHGVRRRLARPHFVHGEHVLTEAYKDGKYVVYGHKLSAPGRLQCDEVRISERKPGTVVASFTSYLRGMFAYVETTEPLRDYSLDGRLMWASNAK